MTHHFPTPEHERLAREGMYHPESEGDAYGLGLVAEADEVKHRTKKATRS